MTVRQETSQSVKSAPTASPAVGQEASPGRDAVPAPEPEDDPDEEPEEAPPAEEKPAAKQRTPEQIDKAEQKAALYDAILQDPELLEQMNETLKRRTGRSAAAAPANGNGNDRYLTREEANTLYTNQKVIGFMFENKDLMSNDELQKEWVGLVGKGIDTQEALTLARRLVKPPPASKRTAQRMPRTEGGHQGGTQTRNVAEDKEFESKLLSAKSTEERVASALSKARQLLSQK